ncbi:diphthamide biosynthesis protein 3 [Cryptococcus depauperatus]|nr:diphthamide biosynthesis protein 3 [Cryptococcus depauperatus CBS 7855]
MPNYYDELEIEDFAWDSVAKVFHYPCPCGDRFEISKAQMRAGEEIAICPSCSLIVRVIYDYLDWEDYVTTDDEDDAQSIDTSLISTPPSREAVDLRDTETENDKKFPPTEEKGDSIEKQIQNLRLQDDDKLDRNTLKEK